jgi:hypothetical protein
VSAEYTCYNCGGTETSHYEGCPAIRPALAQPVPATEREAPFKLVNITSGGYEGWANLIYTGKECDGLPVAMCPPYVAEAFRALLAAQATQAQPQDEQAIENLMHKHGLIGVAGDNPQLEARLLAFARDAATQAERAQPQAPASAVKVERGRVWIVAGNQSFMLAHEGDAEELNWYAGQLRAALSIITPCVKSDSGAAPASAGTLTVEQMWDIAIKALQFYANPKNNVPGAQAREALVAIEAHIKGSKP